MEILQVILTAAASVIALFLLTKLMGNKQVSQLSMFDYIIGISIGSIAAEGATDLENPEHTLAAMIVYALIAWLVSVVTGKSTWMRKVILGRPLILFDKGKFYRRNFKKARIDLSDFLTQCRNQGYFDLSQMRTVVFEYNGSLSILPMEQDRPLTPADLQQNPQQQEVLINVILDGVVNIENLKRTGNDLTWLTRQLHAQKFHSEQEVFLGMVNVTDNTLLAFEAEQEGGSADPFE